MNESMAKKQQHREKNIMKVYKKNNKENQLLLMMIKKNPSFIRFIISFFRLSANYEWIFLSFPHLNKWLESLVWKE